VNIDNEEIEIILFTATWTEVEIILAGYQLSQEVNYLNTPMKEQ
jgi:hypothetical protein